MLRSLRNTTPLSLVLLAAAACSGHRTPEAASTRAEDAGQLSARLLDEIVLEESDTAFVGSPGTDFVVARDGAIYVPDRSTERVYRYDPQGQLLTIIGRRGSGPGELRGVGIAIAVGDSVLAVPGYQNFRVSLFDRFSGRYLGAARYGHFLSSLRLVGHRAWFGTPERATNRTVGWFDLHKLEEADSLPLIQGIMGPLPAEYTMYPGLIVFDDVLVLPMGDSLLVGTGGSNSLTLMTMRGQDLIKVDVPAHRRRGVDKALLDQVFRIRNQPAAVTFAAISNLAGMWRLPDGSVLLYHRDLAEDDPTASNSQTIGRAFVSILAPSLNRACVDAEIPYREPIYPRITMHADTLYQLDQVYEAGAESPRVRTVVRRYLLDTSNCRWDVLIK